MKFSNMFSMSNLLVAENIADEFHGNATFSALPNLHFLNWTFCPRKLKSLAQRETKDLNQTSVDWNGNYSKLRITRPDITRIIAQLVQISQAFSSFSHSKNVVWLKSPYNSTIFSGPQLFELCRVYCIGDVERILCSTQKTRAVVHAVVIRNGRFLNRLCDYI